MTTAWLQHRSTNGRARYVSKLLMAVLVCLVFGPAASAQEPPRHWLHAGALPPGAIGSLRLRRGGPLSGYLQPVRIRVPDGTRIALAVDGQFMEASFGDALAGLLVGPVYRIELPEIPNNPGVAIYPTVELIDRLYPPPGLALRFPIPIDITEEELELAARGVFVTRVIYVEDPSQALPIVQKDMHTPWMEARPGEDPLVVADRLGRPIAILRIGARAPANVACDDRFTYGTPTVELYDESLVPPLETATGGWPTYRLPCDDSCLEVPCPSCDACDGGAPCGTCAMCNGNLIGPPDEYICDGGDYGLPVGVHADFTIDGLDQEDTVAHFDTLDHRVVIRPSNRVCLYAPRFAAVRRATSPMLQKHRDIPEAVLDDLELVRAREALQPASSLQRHAPNINVGLQPPSRFRQRQQPAELKERLQLLEEVGLLAPYANLKIIRTGQLDNNEKPWLATAIQAAITWAGDQSPQIVIDNREAVAVERVQQAAQTYGFLEPHSPELRLCKLASTGNALPGQIVEFTLRFDNIGDQVIGNVTIVDNLSTRLEYVPDSAKSSLEANFSTQANEGGSSILRWEIKKPLEPGDGGILQFRCTVR